MISHMLPSGEEKPIAFASHALTRSEENYAQLEKEALALVFGIKNFHHFLYGRRLTLLTDHKPLTTILGSHTGIPPLAAGCNVGPCYCQLTNMTYGIDSRSGMEMQMLSLGYPLLVLLYYRCRGVQCDSETLPVTYSVPAVENSY